MPAGVFPGLDFPAVRQVFLPVFATACAAYLERTRITVPPGVADVAYLATQGLPVSERRGRDQALLNEYLDDLAAQGESDYPFDEAWRDYRLATGYLMMLPVISLPGAEAMPERSRQLCITLTDRAVAAIDEIDAVAAFS